MRADWSGSPVAPFGAPLSGNGGHCVPGFRTCPACDADNRSQRAGPYGRDPWIIKTCVACDFTYLENAPADEAFAEDFAWEKTSAAEDRRRHRARPLAKRLSDVLKKLRRDLLRRDKLLRLIRRYLAPGPCVDLGCGSGGVLSRLPPAAIPYGIEISPVLAREADAVARARGGRVVQAGCIDGLRSWPADFFSGALLSAFLEHESRPRELLGELHRTLRPGAVAIIKVPNFGSLNRRVRSTAWCGFRFPDHMNYFTATSLAAMVRRSGFRVTQCAFADHFPLSDNLWMVVGKADR
ncbi:MAG: class I SAM-dependent methyltransferase [Opitutaceae bacterium]